MVRKGTRNVYETLKETPELYQLRLTFVLSKRLRNDHVVTKEVRLYVEE